MLGQNRSSTGSWKPAGRTEAVWMRGRVECELQKAPVNKGREQGRKGLSHKGFCRPYEDLQFILKTVERHYISRVSGQGWEGGQ